MIDIGGSREENDGKGEESRRNGKKKESREKK